MNKMFDEVTYNGNQYWIGPYNCFVPIGCMCVGYDGINSLNVNGMSTDIGCEDKPTEQEYIYNFCTLQNDGVLLYTGYRHAEKNKKKYEEDVKNGRVIVTDKYVMFKSKK